MNLAAYKADTLARADVDDIVRVEPVEMRPNITKNGYEQVVHTTETGKTITKYDVHLMRVVDGIKQFTKEHIAIVNEGKEDEEVVFTQPSTKPVDRVVSKLERYIKNLPYLKVEDVEIDPEAKSATLEALKDNGDGTATKVEVYAYIKKIKNAPDTEAHVEILK